MPKAKTPTEYAMFRDTVDVITEVYWQRYRALFERPKHRRGKALHLDHRVTIRDGFRLGIDPLVLAHPGNWELISAEANKSKGGVSTVDPSLLPSHIESWESAWTTQVTHPTIHEIVQSAIRYGRAKRFMAIGSKRR